MNDVPLVYWDVTYGIDFGPDGSMIVASYTSRKRLTPGWWYQASPSAEWQRIGWLTSAMLRNRLTEGARVMHVEG